VSHFQAWNEPNLAVQITPQWTRTRTGSVPASPQIYRGLLNAVYTNVKAVQPRAFVLAAGTAPYGDPPGGDRMRPVVFWRELLCLHGASMRRERCPHPAHLDGLDHHPYAANPVVPAHNRDDVSVPDFRKLWGVLDVAERDHTVLPAGPKPFWMTELEWASRPPDPSGAPPTIQARYLELAFYELWRQGVSHVFWYTISDSPFGSGLYFDDGTPKPAAVAFRFPFVAVATRPGAVTLWGVAPRGGAVTIERVKGHRWQRLVTIRARAGAVFEQRVRLRRNSLLRARIGDLGSLPWPAGWHP
jgi:hypothetical protein